MRRRVWMDRWTPEEVETLRDLIREITPHVREAQRQVEELVRGIKEGRNG